MSNIKISDLESSNFEVLSDKELESISGGRYVVWFAETVGIYFGEKLLEGMWANRGKFGIDSTGNSTLDAINGGNLGA